MGEVYCTGCFAIDTVTGSFATILLLAALLRCWCVGWVGQFYPHMVCWWYGVVCWLDWDGQSSALGDLVLRETRRWPQAAAIEAVIANLNMDDEEEAPIPCEGDLHKEDEDHQFCLVGKALTGCVIHFLSLKRTLADLWHPIGVHNLSYGAISEGLARKLGDFIGQEGFCPVRNAISTQEVEFGWDLSLRAPTRNKLLTESKWLREENPSGFQIGNNSVDMKIDRWKNRGLDKDVTFQENRVIGQRKTV
ncbi:hypothetical protein Gotur_023690 [Gossypium turneri]